CSHRGFWKLSNFLKRQIQYCPSINTFAVCGTSSMKMGVVLMPPSGASNFVKIVLESDGLLGFFSCVAYSHSTKRLLTGGKDGSIRVWIPEERTPENTLVGHFKPVTHVMSHPQEKIFVSLSEDMTVRVWSENTWVCLQRLKVKDMGSDRISCMYYNLHNNELVLANSNIAKCLGKGTDLFKESLTSHEDPIQVLCYHSFFKLVISACRNGTVTVWDIDTGRSVIEFNACVDCMRLTALSIDGSHRRLITATDDGQLRVWNFSSGTELAVLPVTVPGTVTALVCKNSRVFVSQKKSKVIYNLGINGHENRYLEHDYLRDIFSMDVHKKTLVTASTNGNVVVWDIDVCKAAACTEKMD
uniref:WD repeat-containing protein on Y chromosome n=1 Tax=Takifugu rubripes TaxID=31033 RepID=A0A674P847_TAKRU